jgi:putative hydrolase of the HAD superfamily
LRYEAVFLDVDGTLLWVDLDVEGYVEDLKPYSKNGPLTVEKAEGPVWQSLREHIDENVNYRTEEELYKFRRKNACNTARSLGIEAPAEVLIEVTDRRVLFNPYPESEGVMEELVGMGLLLYAVSNWDVALKDVLGSLGWARYFEGIVASARVGSEKPGKKIFEEALRLAMLPPNKVLHVGNDPVSDARGATACGIDAVLIEREGGLETAGARAILPDLSGLPEFIRG